MAVPTAEMATLTGRGGIVLPDPEAIWNEERTDNEYNAYKVIHFFHQIWRLNGFETVLAPDLPANESSPEGGVRELWVPPTETKPFTIVREEYRVKDRSSFNKGWHVKGKEVHSILTPDQDSLVPNEYATVYSHREMWDGSHQPIADRLGQTLGMDWQNKDASATYYGRRVPARYMKLLLDDCVDFLS